MAKINLTALPDGLIALICQPDALDGADIEIEDENGTLIAAIISADAYRFL